MRLLASFLVLLVLLMPAESQAQSPGAVPEDAAADSAAADYTIYTGDGTPASLDDIVQAAQDVSVVFVGEVHDDAGAHAFQDDLFERLVVAASDSLSGPSASASSDGSGALSGRPMALSLEMFERDVQPVVDEYLAGTISERYFRTDARAWSNYVSAYRPLVERARTAQMPVLAANAPRRYVSQVATSGRAALADLSPEAAGWLAPRGFPGPSDAYRQKWMDLMRESMPPGHGTSSPDAESPSDTSEVASAQESPHGHSGASMGGTMLLAQSLWDATMAYTLAQHLTRRPDALVMHVTGAFHVSGGTGTPEALAHYRPGTASLVVLVEPADDPSAFDPEAHADLGDFVILTSANALSRP